MLIKILPIGGLCMLNSLKSLPGKKIGFFFELKIMFIMCFSIAYEMWQDEDLDVRDTFTIAFDAIRISQQ